MKRRRVVLAWLAGFISASLAVVAAVALSGCNGLAGIHEPIEPLDAGIIEYDPDAASDATAVDDVITADVTQTVPPPLPCTGICTPALASGTTGVYRVALDPARANAYFTVQGENAIYRVATDTTDGSSASKVADATAAPYGITVTSSRVYWIAATGTGAAIRSRVLGGDAATSVDSIDAQLFAPNGGIASQDDVVYADDSDSLGGAVWRITGLTALEYGTCTSAGAIAADHDSAYLLDNRGSDIYFYDGPRENKSPLLFDFDAVNGAVGLAINTTTVFWTIGVGGTVWALDKVPGANVPRLLASAQNDASAITTDANGDVYWGTRDAIVTNAGGVTHAIATPPATPTSIVVSARTVYFAAAGGLWKIAKP